MRSSVTRSTGSKMKLLENDAPFMCGNFSLNERAEDKVWGDEPLKRLDETFSERRM